MHNRPHHFLGQSTVPSLVYLPQRISLPGRIALQRSSRSLRHGVCTPALPVPTPKFPLPCACVRMHLAGESCFLHRRTSWHTAPAPVEDNCQYSTEFFLFLLLLLFHIKHWGILCPFDPCFDLYGIVADEREGERKEERVTRQSGNRAKAFSHPTSCQLLFASVATTYYNNAWEVSLSRSCGPWMSWRSKY